MYTKKQRSMINLGGIYRKIVLNFVQTSSPAVNVKVKWKPNQIEIDVTQYGILHKCATQSSKPIISHGTVETLSSKAK